MVGPIPEADRAAFTRKVKVGVAALVGLSAGLTALRVGASFPVASGAALAGLAAGWGLGWFVVPSGPSPAERQRQRREAARENPFGNAGGGLGSGSGSEGDGDGDGGGDGESGRDGGTARTPGEPSP